jgi:hypothetical protein
LAAVAAAALLQSLQAKTCIPKLLLLLLLLLLLY